MSPLLFLSLLVLLATAVATAWWWKWWPWSVARNNNHGDDVHVERMMERLAEIINLLDAGTRSCEIGVWFINRIAAQAMTKSQAVACDKAAADMLDLRAIANAVPGANEVTRTELVVSLTKFVTAAARRACDRFGTVTGPDLARAVQESARFCTAPNGALLTLYPAASRIPLPV